MKKIKLNIPDNVVYQIINDKPEKFLCEHCGEMKRKIYYEEDNGVEWCQLCAQANGYIK